jgi:UDP-N-acetyl-D-glucosamine dehydrogenase
VQKVTIIGQGYVGLTVSVFAAEHFLVTGFDSNVGLVNQLNRGISHIEGITTKNIEKLMKLGRYRATYRPEDIAESDIVIIAVPTPLDESRNPDLSYLEAACKTIGENLEEPALIINESTSYPGTLRNFIKPMIEKYSKKFIEHQYAISPERVDPGRSDYTQKNTSRLFSGLTFDATQKTRNFYAKFCDDLIEVSSPEVAESAKLFENTFRQVNIALVNEFAQITHALGIDVYEVIEAAGTKPYGFMKFSPSAGVGGHCIPVDPTYLAAVAEEHGAPATFIRRANEVNVQMPRYVVDRIKKDNNNSLNKKNILVIGVSYKPDVADVRETPAEMVINHLRDEGARVSWHDDLVREWNGEQSSKLEGADITVVVTKHSSVSATEILKSAKYIFDTTGKVPGAHHL